MASTSSFHQWESDPLFSATEVVQDSVDRMESTFRQLSHEQSLVQGNNPDPKLIMSIEHLKRDLATTLGTAKWQLEDFEREVTLSPTTSSSHIKQNVIARHEQFITAIKEHILNIEKSLDDLSVGGLMRNAEWVNLDEQDRDGLALFLSGGKPVEHVTHNSTHHLEDRNEEIVEECNDELAPLSHEFDKKENRLRNMDYNHAEQIGSQAGPSIREVNFDKDDGYGTWDLEANEAKGFDKIKSSGYMKIINVFGSLGNKLYAYGRTSRNLIKRQKDGEEEGHLPSYINVFHSAQANLTRLRLAAGYSSFRRLSAELFARFWLFCNWLKDCRAKYQRFPYYVQAGQRSDD